jgi:hypothetical protein
MPTSYLDFKNDIKTYIYKKYKTDIKILDIGPGIGTYANLLSDYKNIDCVEIYKPYIKKFDLKSKYKNVYNKNILDFDFDYYDIIIMGDILEHLSVDDSLNLLNKFINKCDDIIVNVPYLADFNHLYDNEPNKNELHIQVDLTEDIMKNRYPMLKKVWSNNRIGVYLFNKYKYNPEKDLAITVYVDDTEYILEELNWLYKSFIFSENYKKSDIIAFCNPSAINKIDINILNDKNVHIIPLDPISRKENLWKNYHFINSIYFLTTKESEILLNYKYTLATDCDVFLTKNLLTLRPVHHTFGMGDYIRSKDVKNKIIYIIKSLNLKNNYLHNVGASYLYKSFDVLNFRRLQYNMCVYLIINEFKDYEGTWGTWFKGTLTMYAGEIVANQLEHGNIRLNILDSYSMSDKKIDNNFYHIHAWHTKQYFSKYDFRNGIYKDINEDLLDISIVNNYCLFLVKKSIDDIKKICNY